LTTTVYQVVEAWLTEVAIAIQQFADILGSALDHWVGFRWASPVPASLGLLTRKPAAVRYSCDRSNLVVGRHLRQYAYTHGLQRRWCVFSALHRPRRPRLLGRGLQCPRRNTWKSLGIRGDDPSVFWPASRNMREQPSRCSSEAYGSPRASQTRGTAPQTQAD
jgi:hypothetical protein